jgi:hypothetical protein
MSTLCAASHPKQIPEETMRKVHFQKVLMRIFMSQQQERGSPHARAGMIVPGSCLALSGAFREEDLVVGWECGGKVKRVEGLLEAIDSNPLGLMDLIEVNPNLKPQTSNLKLPMVQPCLHCAPGWIQLTHSRLR